MSAYSFIRIAFTVAALLGLPAVCIAQATGPAPRYVGQDLGLLPGDDGAIAYGVSEAGSVAGIAFDAERQHAFFWDPASGQMYDLTTPGSTGAAFGASTGAVEYVAGSEGSRAVVWVSPPSAPLVLDQPGSIAMGVNRSGVVVGYARGNAAVWTPGAQGYSRSDIAPSPGHVEAYGRDINDSGIVVGYGYQDVTYLMTPFVHVPGVGTFELPHAAGSVDSHASGVSETFDFGGHPHVYVMGSSGSTPDTERGMKWTVRIDTGEVVATEIYDAQWLSGLSSAGDLVGTGLKGRGKQYAVIVRDGAYIALKPPKGGSGGSAFDVDGGNASPAYVAGVAFIKSSLHPVRWVLE